MSRNLSDILRDHGISQEDIISIINDYTESLIKESSVKQKKKKVVIGPSKLYVVTDVKSSTIRQEILEIRRGDIVWSHNDAEESHRDMGKYVWDGHKAIKFYEEIYDTGTLPPEFTINEFSDPQYFSKSVESEPRWIKFNIDDIMRVTPSDDTSGEVIVTIGLDSGHTYSLVYSGKKTRKSGIYKDFSNKFVEGALAISEIGNDLFMIH